MTRNSFRLLEVFNRHFKLKKEEACKKKGKKRGKRQKGERKKEKGTEISRGLFLKNKERHAHRLTHTNKEKI